MCERPGKNGDIRESARLTSGFVWHCNFRSPQTKATGVLMRQTDIVIAGGGLAGSTAAAMLARDGYRVVLVDPHTVYPPELRCEKLDGPQTAILHRTGLADAVLRAGTFDGGSWV